VSDASGRGTVGRMRRSSQTPFRSSHRFSQRDNVCRGRVCTGGILQVRQALSPCTGRPTSHPLEPVKKRDDGTQAKKKTVQTRCSEGANYKGAKTGRTQG